MVVQDVVYTTEGDTIVAYVTTAPKIKGYGKTKCEAVSDLVDKYRSIATTLDLLSERQDQCDA